MGELLAGEGGVVRGREEMSRCESGGTGARDTWRPPRP